MAKYLLKVQESLSQLGEWVIEKIPKEYDWIVDIRAHLQAGTFLEDPKRAHKTLVQASHFFRVSLIRNSVEAAPIRMATYQQKVAFLSHIF